VMETGIGAGTDESHADDLFAHGARHHSTGLARSCLRRSDTTTGSTPIR
jgi:hypothetical protein